MRNTNLNSQSRRSFYIQFRNLTNLEDAAQSFAFENEVRTKILLLDVFIISDKFDFFLFFLFWFDFPFFFCKKKNCNLIFYKLISLNYNFSVTSGKELYVSENLGDKRGKIKVELSCGSTLVTGDNRIDFYHRNLSKVCCEIKIGPTTKKKSQKKDHKTKKIKKRLKKK